MRLDKVIALARGRFWSNEWVEAPGQRRVANDCSAALRTALHAERLSDAELGQLLACVVTFLGHKFFAPSAESQSWEKHLIELIALSLGSALNETPEFKDEAQRRLTAYGR